MAYPISALLNLTYINYDAQKRATKSDWLANVEALHTFLDEAGIPRGDERGAYTLYHRIGILRSARDNANELLRDAEKEMDAIKFAAHLPADYQYGLASWINQVLYACYVGARISPHIATAIEDGTLTFPNAPVWQDQERLATLLREARAAISAHVDACNDQMCAGESVPDFSALPAWLKNYARHDKAQVTCAVCGKVNPPYSKTADDKMMCRDCKQQIFGE